MVVVSGNRPVEYIMQQTQRLAFVDGRMENLPEKYPPLLMPLISERWTKYFSWKGRGEMPEKEREQLRAYVQQAHEQGKLLRFRATPDSPGKEREAVWLECWEAGVDLINTDDLAGLRAFLSAREERIEGIARSICSGLCADQRKAHPSAQTNSNDTYIINLFNVSAPAFKSIFE